jgi:hypothetical protein
MEEKYDDAVSITELRDSLDAHISPAFLAGKRWLTTP